MDDPYTLLGVKRDATADQIKRAYRKLARELHPDLHPDDKKAEDRFKQVGSAYELLSDAKQRARFDAGEIDANGAEQRMRRAAGAGQAGAGPGGGAGFDDLWGEILRRQGRAPGGRGRRFPFEVEEDEFPERGADAQFQLHLAFPEAALGTIRRLTLPGGKNLDVKVRPASFDGTVLRLKAQGSSGARGGESGDALIEIKVDPHPYFTREGDDVLLTLPVTLPEAVLGAKVTVPTIDGKVTLTVPPGSNTGAIMRLKGKGVPRAEGRGDQLVTLQVVLPEKPDPDLESFLKKWGSAHPYEVREKLEG